MWVCTLQLQTTRVNDQSKQVLFSFSFVMISCMFYIYTLQVVSKPTSVSTNWFFKSPSIVTGTPITYKLYCSISATWGALFKAAHELNEVLTFVENIIPLWHIVKSSSQTQWGTDIRQQYHSLGAHCLKHLTNSMRYWHLSRIFFPCFHWLYGI